MFFKPDKARKKFLLIGYYGFNNTGDDVLTYIFIDKLNKLFNYPEFIIRSINKIYLPEKTNAYFFVSILRRKLWLGIIPLIKILFADAVIIGGGGLFHDPKSKQDPTKGWWHNVFKYYYTKFDWYTLLFKILKKKIFFLNLSIGSLSIDYNLNMVHKIMQRGNLATLRDLKSSTYLQGKSIKHEICFDAGILINDYVQSQPGKNSDNNILGISVLDFSREDICFSGDVDLIYKNLISVLNNFLETDSKNKVYLFDFHGGEHELSDTKVNDLIYKQLKENAERISYNENPVKTAEVLKECNTFIGTRLHSCIFSYAFQIPFILINYHEKSAEFANMINLPNEYILSVNDLADYTKLDNIFKLLQNTDFSAMNLLPYEDAYNKANSQFAMIKNILN